MGGKILIAVLTMFLLAGCGNPAAPVSSPAGSFTEDYSPFIEAFDASEQCPHVCWLGINPGVTSAEEARALLSASDQIDQKTFKVPESGIETIWLTGMMKTLHWRVGVVFEEGLVQSINFGGGASSLKMKDFISLIGEPDRISIRVNKEADAEYISYMVYYFEKKTRIEISPGSQNGPDPDDTIITLILSTEFDEDVSPFWLAEYNNYCQPWLGYGHLQEYLLRQKLPTGPCQP